MNNTTIIKNTETTKTKNQPEDITYIGTTKMTEITNHLFEQIKEGEVCRFGTGWILLCPLCNKMIFTDKQFKTFSAPDREFYRLAPSVKCPNNNCEWHKMIVIEPETKIEIKSEGIQNEQKVEDETQPGMEA